MRRLTKSLADLRGALPVHDGVIRSLAADLKREPIPGEAADLLSQAIVCGTAMTAEFVGEWQGCRRWLLDQSAPWERFILDRIGAGNETKSGASFSQLTHLYEHLLRHDQPERRKRAGVFFTPQPIVRHMLVQIDSQLQNEFSLPLGLADEATWRQVRRDASALELAPQADDSWAFLRIFDPAVGTGAFLLESIDFIHARLVDRWQQDGMDHRQIAERWNEYVPRSLLPRLWGTELLAVPCFLARLHVALKLAQTGYRFGSPVRMEIRLGNTLEEPTPQARDVPFTVILGNPPFSYLSENRSEWITSLIRGDNGHAGYVQADGQKLGEKKTWLHDDYVKFLRYAQWRIDSRGCGIVAFVTNHGYLTNATFRILRQQLLRSFPRITVLDLHGNRKACEVAPDGDRDENIMGLDQGIAIGFFRRPPGDKSPSFEHAELWGSRASKLDRLDVRQVENLSYVPAAPEYRFVPASGDHFPEYAAAPSLTDLLPLHATAPVTARDRFVVAFTRAELCQRIETFRDLSIPDEQIRRRYFTRTRSPRYERGDTRSWKLAEARRIIAGERDWQSFIQPCQYRPLDWRWIFWHPAMIDWPRLEVTRHLNCHSRCAPTNEPVADSISSRLALIARRQLPPSEPCGYFWATSALTLDGVIRNDNRGSESLFPLVGESGSLELAQFAYALFHSPTYRQRYSHSLRTGFPRVPMPRDSSLTAALADFGRQLLVLHTRQPPSEADRSARSPGLAVAPRYPRHAQGRILIRDDWAIASASPEVWNFRAGAHQVARKWLSDRCGRPLHDADVGWYGVIIDTIDRTQRLMTDIDGMIATCGGFPQAFEGAGN